MISGSFIIGRVRGVELRVHWSWIIILALATVVFGSTELPGRYPDLPEPGFWALGLITAFLLLCSALIHELAHVLVAVRNGLGGGDVNVQLLGGTYILEVHPTTPGQQFRLALVGPLVSVVVGLFCAVAAATTNEAPGLLGLVSYPAIVLALFNLFIGFVNLIPGYPLDGGSLVRSIAWRVSRREGRATQIAARTGRYVGYLFVMLGIAAATIEFWTGIVILLGGWLLAAGGSSMERRETLRGLVAHLRVRDATEDDLGHVPAQLTLDTFASDYLALPGTAVVVERAGVPVGMIGSIQANRVRRNWASMHASDVMVPLDRVPVASNDDQLWHALEELERLHLDALVVRTDATATDGTVRGGTGTDGTDPAALQPDETLRSDEPLRSDDPLTSEEAHGSEEPRRSEEPHEAEEPPRPQIVFLTRRSAARAVHQLAQQQAGVALALRAMRQGGGRPRFWWSRGRGPDRPEHKDGDEDQQ